jgi:hypothetical protein
MKIKYPAFMRQNLLCVVLFGLFPIAGYSQEAGSCAEKLKTAQSLFDKGQVEQIPSMLSECLKSGFNREESLAAYKLLIQSYQFEDKLELTDSVMLTFLKKNPEYQVSPTDYSSFVYLFNSFKVKPVVQISLHLGTNLPFLTFIDVKSVASEPGKNSYNTPVLNIFGSVEAKIELNKKFEINVETGYSQIVFTNIEDFMGFSKTTYTETQNRIEIPVSVTYNIKNFGKITPYARLGFGPALTLGSAAKAKSDPTDLDGTLRPETNIDRKESRIGMDFFTQIGAGVKFKTKGGFVVAEIRSNFGIFNQTIRAGTSSEDELSTSYYYVDDDFNINTLNFSLGYTRIFYKPSKRK